MKRPSNKGRVSKPLSVKLPPVAPRPPARLQLPYKTLRDRFVNFLRFTERALPIVLIMLVATWALFGSDQGKDLLRSAVGDGGQIFKIMMTVLVVCVIGGTCIVYLLRFGAATDPTAPDIDRDHASLAVGWLLIAAALVLIFLFGASLFDDPIRNAESSKTFAFLLVVLFIVTIVVVLVLLIVIP